MERRTVHCCNRMEEKKCLWTKEEDNKLVSYIHRYSKLEISSNTNRMEEKKGPWTEEEDNKLFSYSHKYDHQNWRSIPIRAGIKHGNFTKEEEETIIQLQRKLGNQWPSKIASFLPGRTDNAIKNIWNTYLKKITLPQNSNYILKSGAGTSSMIEAQIHCDISSNNLPANPVKPVSSGTEHKDLAVPIESGKDPIGFGESQKLLKELEKELELFDEVEVEENWAGRGDPVAAYLGNLGLFWDDFSHDLFYLYSYHSIHHDIIL